MDCISNSNPNSTTFLIDFVVPASLRLADIAWKLSEVDVTLDPEMELDEGDLDAYFTIRPEDPMDDSWFFEEPVYNYDPDNDSDIDLNE
jgi:hypothetical protein